MNFSSNFECHVTDDDAIISFDQRAIRMPLSEAESLQHRLARHVFTGEGGFDLSGTEIEMDDAFVLCEVMKVVFEEG